MIGSRGLKAEGSGRDKENAAQEAKAKAEKRSRWEMGSNLDAERREGVGNAKMKAVRSKEEALHGWGTGSERGVEAGGQEEQAARPCRNWNCEGG